MRPHLGGPGGLVASTSSAPTNTATSSVVLRKSNLTHSTAVFTAKVQILTSGTYFAERELERVFLIMFVLFREKLVTL